MGQLPPPYRATPQLLSQRAPPPTAPRRRRRQRWQRRRPQRQRPSTQTTTGGRARPVASAARPPWRAHSKQASLPVVATTTTAAARHRGCRRCSPTQVQSGTAHPLPSPSSPARRPPPYPLFDTEEPARLPKSTRLFAAKRDAVSGQPRDRSVTEARTAAPPCPRPLPHRSPPLPAARQNRAAHPRRARHDGVTTGRHGDTRRGRQWCARQKP